MIQFHGNLVRDISVRYVSFPDSSVQKFTVGVGQNFQKRKKIVRYQIKFPSLNFMINGMTFFQTFVGLFARFLLFQ